ncbi:hypothetical protein EDB94_3497 [Marinobacter sp. 3-2]|jgi:hypothetical protein|nr:hypothetical protein EDB94_3497 [Marinobacter sp. 3-2]
MMCWRCIFSPNKALLSDKFAAERGVMWLLNEH